MQQALETRMDAFHSAISAYKSQQLRIIQEKGHDQQQYQYHKLLKDCKDRDQQMYQKKFKNIDVEIKIIRSRKINDLRMNKMKARFQVIEQLQQNIKVKLLEKIKNQTVYNKLLKDLIIQGLIKLLQETVEVKCRRQDYEQIKKIMKQCEEQFASMSTIRTKLILNDKHPLPQSDIGGIILTCNKGRIVCNNTLKARLDYAMQQSLPSIRRNLFENPRDKVI